MQKSKQIIKEKFKWTFLSIVSGFLAGSAATIFLVLLDIATQYRQHNQSIIWFLPIAGFAIGWIYFHHGKEANKGNNLILDEIHDPKKITLTLLKKTDS